MGTAVEQRADIELELLVEDETEPSCSFCEEVATHNWVLSCNCSDIVGPKCIARIRETERAHNGWARCFKCKRRACIKSIHPI